MCTVGSYSGATKMEIVPRVKGLTIAKCSSYSKCCVSFRFRVIFVTFAPGCCVNCAADAKRPWISEVFLQSLLGSLWPFTTVAEQPKGKSLVFEGSSCIV